MKIKLCGMMRCEDIAYANEAMPDYIGFIFANGRRRTVTKEHAAKMKAMLSPKIKSVAVFLDNDINDVIDIANSGIADLIQLHGSEDISYLEKLRKAIPSDMPIIKAFSVKSEEDVKRAYMFPSDYLLLDNGNGGTGKAFSWELLGEGPSKQVFLAGGISTENIADAVKLSPYCIDVSSGAETNGVKDREKMLALVKAVRFNNQQGKG